MKILVMLARSALVYAFIYGFCAGCWWGIAWDFRAVPMLAGGCAAYFMLYELRGY